MIEFGSVAQALGPPRRHIENVGGAGTQNSQRERLFDALVGQGQTRSNAVAQSTTLRLVLRSLRLVPPVFFDNGFELQDCVVWSQYKFIS